MTTRTGGPQDLTPLVAVLTLAALLTAYALYAFRAVGMDRSDFYLFYRSGQAWLSGTTPYLPDENPNLNPPGAIVAVFAPLARLPYQAAQAIWTAAGVLSLAASLRIAARVAGLTRLQVLWAVALAGVTHAAFLVWLQGQVTWILLYPITRAWAALRQERSVQAGLWLAPVVAFKPVLALLPLVLPWPVWLTAGVGSAALTLAGIAWTGWDPWRTWLDVGSSVRWLGWPPNASLWGLAARLESGAMKNTALQDIHPAAMVAIACAGGILAMRAMRERSIDRRVVLALFWTLLLSPLGWIYYLPLGLGPIVATWPGGALAWIAFGSTILPFHMVQGWFDSPAVVRTLGCIYGIGLLCAWAAWTRNEKRSGAGEAAVRRHAARLRGESRT